MSSNQTLIEADTAVAPVQVEQVPVRRKPRRSSNFLTLVMQNRKAAMGAIILLIFALMAIFAPVIAPYDPTDYVGRARQAPSSDFWFGTTGSGQDVLSQTIYGARVSLGTGLLVGFLTTALGALVGMSAGYFRGRVDDILSLVTNVILIIPSIPLLIILAAFLPAGFWTIVAVLTLTGWSWGARVLRSQTLTLREKDFVSSAVVTGERSMRIIFREILPNMTSIVVAGMFGAINYAIGAQAGLEFLGLGNPSAISWGTNLYWAQNNAGLLTGAWWTIIPSGLCIALVAFAFALINYAIDEVTNPRLRSQRQTAEILKHFDRRLRSSRATPVVRQASEA
jgi:peptide/nickel transport system permease protein